MRLSRVLLLGYRSVSHVDFEAGPFTVLFGKNNVGKTNVLEAILGVLAPTEMPGHFAGDTLARGVRGPDDALPPRGAVYAQLDPGHPFDDEVLASACDGAVALRGADTTLHLDRLPPGQVAFTGNYDRSGAMFLDPASYYTLEHDNWMDIGDDVELSASFAAACARAPRPIPLFVDWEFTDISKRVTAAIGAALPSVSGRPELGSNWYERIDGETPDSWRLRPDIRRVVNCFLTLVNGLLPDFVDGSIVVDLDSKPHRAFGLYLRLPDAPRSLSVWFQEHGGQRSEDMADIGRGVTRWFAASVQIALHILKQAPAVAVDAAAGLKDGAFSGHVLFIDEPEAHLHPSAVQSMVRWCERMVSLGFNVVVASHHEEFLRPSAGGQTLIHITRDAGTGQTRASALPSLRATRLLELAADIGIHPAAALSVRRAIPFVEGPLDVAVLEEFAELELDAAGVMIVPIHGTKNLEGLVAVELVTDLGIKTGVLTDDTDPMTMYGKVRGRRSSEEKKIIDVLEIAETKGLLRPAVFGIPEKDLLFALPAEAIRDHRRGPFPGWKELVAECRQSLGKTPSDSVDWKHYAAERYGLRIDTPGGVRDLVRALDLANVSLPSIRTVVGQIIDWAQSDA